MSDSESSSKSGPILRVRMSLDLCLSDTVRGDGSGSGCARAQFHMCERMVSAYPMDEFYEKLWRQYKAENLAINSSH